MSADSREIGSQRAAEIAKEVVVDKAEIAATSTLSVERRDQTYVVTFVRHNPPGILTGDYDARVTIDARTGMVLEILGAP